MGFDNVLTNKTGIALWGISLFGCSPLRPGGTVENSPGLQSWVRHGPHPLLVPEGRLKFRLPFRKVEVQPSLRDSSGFLVRGGPRTEVLGYSQPSLRDERGGQPTRPIPQGHYRFLSSRPIREIISCPRLTNAWLGSRNARHDLAFGKFAQVIGSRADQYLTFGKEGCLICCCGRFLLAGPKRM